MGTSCVSPCLAIRGGGLEKGKGRRIQARDGACYRLPCALAVWACCMFFGVSVERVWHAYSGMRHGAYTRCAHNGHAGTVLVLEGEMVVTISACQALSFAWGSAHG